MCPDVRGIGICTLCMLAGAALGDNTRYYKDHLYIPPIEQAEKELYDRRFPLPESTVNHWLRLPMKTWANDLFATSSSTMKQKRAAAPENQVAVGRQVALDVVEIVGAPTPYADGHLFIGAVASTNAHALRLNVDLLGLREDERLWLLDAFGRAVFGPYGAKDAQDGNNRLWLPTTFGDRVVIALQSPRKTPPLMMVNALSHFYRPMFMQKDDLPAALPCHIPIAEESDPVIQELSTGVCMLLIPKDNSMSGCTAALLNGPVAGDGLPEPYLLSAAHCFTDASDDDGIEVYWDYRFPTEDMQLPEEYKVPRNTGIERIASNDTLDMAFIKLRDTAENGVYGRAWLGWDTHPPEKNDSAQTIHHPMFDKMKTSRGSISRTAPVIDASLRNGLIWHFYNFQTIWRDGVIEHGSSGAPLINKTNNYRIAGVLCQTTGYHNCDPEARNLVMCGAFARFFPEIGCHLQADYECHAPRCFLRPVLGVKGETATHLRRFRDVALTEYPLGRLLIADYYALLPTLSQWAEQSRSFKACAQVAVTLGAAWGATL